MQKGSFTKLLRLVTLVSLLTIAVSAVALAQEKGSLTGTLETVVKKFKTITVKTPTALEVISYDEKTELKNSAAKDIGDLGIGLHLDVEYRTVDGKKVADVVSVKVGKVDPADVIKTEDVARLLEKTPQEGKYLIIDSRPKQMFDMGHIPTSVSLHTDKWEELKDKVLPKDKDIQLVFYCGGITCRLSPKATNLAKELGYKNPKAYVYGLPGWKAAGKPTVIAAEAVEKLVAEAQQNPSAPPFFVVIDFRAAQEIEKGHIPFSTAISPQKLIEDTSVLPKDKKAQIILVTEKDITPEALSALQTLYKEKYRNPAILDGGFAAWQKAGYKVATGKASEKISYAKKLTPDEISIQEFLEIVEKKPPQTLIVDVRTEEDHKGGAVPGAAHVPLEVIQKDPSKLPKDKELILYCNTGATSSTAHEVLKQKGFKSRYLNATITYQNGKPVISE